MTHHAKRDTVLPSSSRRATAWLAAAFTALSVHYSADSRGAPDPADVLTLTLSAALLHDNNLFRLPDGNPGLFGVAPDGRADTISTLGVALKLDKTISRQRVVVEVAVQENSYQRNSRLDHTAGKGSAQWLWEYGNLWNGELRFDHQRRLSGFADLAANVKNLVNLDTALMTAGYRLDAHWRVWGGLVLFETENSALTQIQNDTQVTTVLMGVDYRSRADNTIGLQVRRAEGLFPHREVAAAQLFNNEYTETSPALTWAWNVTGQTRFDGRLGYTVREHNQFPARDFSGPTFQLHYAGVPTGKLRIDANAWRELWTAESQTSSYVVASGVRVTPLWAVTAKFSLRGSLSYETRSYEGDPGVVFGIPVRDDTLRMLQLEAIYSPWRNVDIRFLLERGVRDSNRPGNQYEYDSALLNLKLNF